MNDMNPRRHKTQLLLASANKKRRSCSLTHNTQNLQPGLELLRWRFVHLSHRCIVNTK